MTRHILTPDERRKGGQARAATLTPEERRKGGQARAAQPSFHQLQVERGRKGAAVTLERYGMEFLLRHLADWRRAHPTAPEAWVAQTLEALGLQPGQDYVAQQVVTAAGRAGILDFVCNGPDAVVVVEPGDRRWHGSPAETFDGADRAAWDAARDRELAVSLGYTVVRIDAAAIQQDPAGCVARIQAALLGQSSEEGAA